MKNFEYIYPKTIESIPAILSDTRGQSLLYAGGTDALARIKEGVDSPKQIVNLKSVKDLTKIEEASDGLHIGAGTLLADIAENNSVQKYPGLLEAAQSVGTPQLRNMGTLGGNLCQRPRCWYYRSRHFPCARKEGDICFAVDGRNKYHAILGGDACFIVHPSDLAPMLIALDAKVKILGPNGEREIPLDELFILPSQDILKETVLNPQELITQVIVPPPSGKSHYLKFRERKSIDFALVSVALSANISGKNVSNVIIVLGGVAPKPWRAKKAENALEGKEASNYNVEQAAAAEMEDAVALEQNEYKVVLTKNLIRKAFRELLA
jgi:xanthine dehydrogenase YagS FAD-binding subunit